MRNDIVVYLGLSFLGYPSFLNIHVFAIPRLRSCAHFQGWISGFMDTYSLGNLYFICRYGVFDYSVSTLLALFQRRQSEDDDFGLI